MKKIILATIIASAMTTSAFAATDQGHGKVTFIGEIIDAPCSISPDSIDQTVQLGQIANAVIVNNGTSTAVPFTIELEDCFFSDANPSLGNKVTVTWTGTVPNGNTSLLAMTGFTGNAAQASNVGVQINNTDGTPVVFGATDSILNQLQNGNNTLQYSAFVASNVQNPKLSDIPLGSFTAVTNFTLAYN